MKGNIYTDEQCACGGVLKHDENIDNFRCSECNRVQMPVRMRVRFGRSQLRFTTYREARQFLNGLRFKAVEGTYDERDYQKDNPLGFSNQVERYLEIKKESGISNNGFREIKNHLNKAMRAWGQRNVKTIGFSDIEDWLFNMRGVKGKTKANARSALLSFFKWLNRREGIPVPEMPDVKFELGWRNIIDLDTQQAIIAEVQTIAPVRAWIGIKWLATYVAIRPNEMRNLKERHIDVSGFFVIPSPKEKDPKLVAMLPEDIELYHSTMPRVLPNMFFFRHMKGNGSAARGSQFGKDYFYKWWKRACANLGIEGVDLYGGTRHSTTTALGEHFSEDQLMKAGSFHKTNSAFKRYMQSKKNDSINIYQKARELQGEVLEFKRHDRK
jgi:hypothetical protein